MPSAPSTAPQHLARPNLTPDPGCALALFARAIVRGPTFNTESSLPIGYFSATAQIRTFLSFSAGPPSPEGTSANPISTSPSFTSPSAALCDRRALWAQAHLLRSGPFDLRTVGVGLDQQTGRTLLFNGGIGA